MELQQNNINNIPPFIGWEKGFKMLFVKLFKHSCFNNEQHFIDCLKDMVIEWEDMVGAKEMDKEDVGFNCERLKELKLMLRMEKEKI